MPEPLPYHFVGEDAAIMTGEDARRRLADVNDAQYLSEGQGVTRVPPARWEVAQRFERTGWLETWTGATDDRNIDHFHRFDGYAALRGRAYDHAIELGCGPFTNLRVIAGVVKIGRVTLLDPLAESYLGLPTVTYDRTRLKIVRPIARWAQGQRTLARRIVRKVIQRFPALTWGSVPVHELLVSPIETMPPRPAAFDLVVIINVIQHCYDLSRIFDSILEISRPGAMIVFNDCLYDHKTVAAMLQGHHYEAGHPLMADAGVIEKFLHDHYDTEYEQYSEESVDHPMLKSQRVLSFIGRRKAQ